MEETKRGNNGSVTGAVIKSIAILFIMAGSLGNFYYAIQVYGLQSGTFWVCEIAVFAMGMLFYGIGEIIDLLTDIKRKLK